MLCNLLLVQIMVGVESIECFVANLNVFAECAGNDIFPSVLPPPSSILYPNQISV